MKTLPWFRLYAEAVDDEKLRLLAFEDRWHFVALLCCKARGILDEPDTSQLRLRKVAVKLGLDPRELIEVARRLGEVGLIDSSTLQPTAWEERQYQSDNSTERVRAYRERMKQAEKRDETVSVTAQETDTETDTENFSLSPDGERVGNASGASPESPARINGYHPPPADSEAVVAAYHEILPALSRVVSLTPARKAAIRQRWREVCVDSKLDAEGARQFFRDYWTRVSRSEFLMGKGRPAKDREAFVATFDWLIAPRNFIKVIEGNYDPKRRAA